MAFTSTDAESGGITTGLTTAFEITTQDITDTATALPTGGALTNRNHVAIANLSATDTLYIGPAATVESNRTNGGLAGWEIAPGEQFHIDITDSIAIFGIAESGNTIKIKVLEVS